MPLLFIIGQATCYMITHATTALFIKNPRTCSVALFSDRSPRAHYLYPLYYTSMNVFSNSSSSSIAMLHWGGTLLLCNDPQRRQYLGVSYTGRQVNVQSIVLVYRSYSYPLESITANRRADSTGCTVILHAVSTLHMGNVTRQRHTGYIS